MRIGVNPEKNKGDNNIYYYHRIIIPVYIPSETGFYEESILILKKCLDSVVNTINHNTTKITVVNNSSYEKVTWLLENYFKNKLIEKLVTYSENKGKVFAVISEAKASYEPYITIMDADILLFSGWEIAVMDIFQNFSKAGAVAPLPLPNLCFHKNSSVFFHEYFFGNIGYDKIVSEESCNLYLKGMGNDALLRRNNRKYSWRDKQYFLKGKSPALLGCGHFVATYRKEIFKGIVKFPERKFINGYEESFLDDKVDMIGLYRLSTVKTYAYHMGNKLDMVGDENPSHYSKVSEEIFHWLKPARSSGIPYSLRKLVFRFLKRIRNL